MAPIYGEGEFNQSPGNVQWEQNKTVLRNGHAFSL